MLLIMICIGLSSKSQTYIVNEQFSATSPTTWLTTTPSGWALNNYGSGNALSGTYALRLSGWNSSSPKYLYIPISVQEGYTYTISFWTKRICSVKINVNETTNQTTLLETDTYTNSSCSSNFSTWYQWSSTFVAGYTGTAYYQILATSTYFSTTIYIEDVLIYESPPVSLPIELLYFTVASNNYYNKLVWETASEYNNDYYTIYHSGEDVNWEIIDHLKGSGTSSHSIKYTYLHKWEIPGIHYYKISQTDYDGKIKEYDPVSILNTREGLAIVGRTNMLGQDIDENYKGRIILIYSDGSKGTIYVE
jgi:hypothetical protein